MSGQFWLPAVALATAFLSTALLTPIARRLAVRLEILDHPRKNKAHHTPTPYLGGLAILVGLLLGVLGSGAWRELGGLVVAVLLLASVGLLDDVRSLPVPLRLSVYALTAGIAVTFGIQGEPFGIPALDLAISLLWILGITNAFNLLDNINGLTAGVAAVSGTAFLMGSILSGQYLVAALAAAVVGAALGFLPHNFPRARIFMGDGGSLVLGFLLAVVSLKLRWEVPPPWSFLAPVCVLYVAVTDSAVVVLDRLRSSRPVMVGATDHLSHRLVALGLSPAWAVGLLLGASALLGLLGVGIGHRVLPPEAAVAGVVGTLLGGLALISVTTSSAYRVTEGPVSGR